MIRETVLIEREADLTAVQQEREVAQQNTFELFQKRS